MRTAPVARRITLALAVLAMAAPAIAQDKKAEPNPLRPQPKSNEAWWMQRHQKFLDRTKQGDIGLLFIGDSITHGWEEHGKDGKEGAAEIWERHYAPRKAANLGIGGDQTGHVLWRLDNGEVEGISPRVAVVMIGTNNVPPGDSPEDIAAGIKAVVEKLREKLPETKVLLLGVFPRGEKPNPMRDRIKDINERISKLDDGGKHVKYLDIGKNFLDEDGTLPKEIMPDFLHLSPKGYRIWADSIEPTLWNLMESK